jgi:RND family efflux transporter MFP subunit
MKHPESPDSPDPTQPPTLPSNTWSRRLWGFIPWLFLLLLICIVALMAMRIGEKQTALKVEKARLLKKERPAINVVTLKIVPSPIHDRIRLPGEVTPWVKLDILAEVRGRIVSKKVKEGQTVGKGALIAVIDSRDFDNILVQTRAEYDAAQKTLKRLNGLLAEKLATQAQLDNAKARVDGLKAAMSMAELNAKRCRIRASAAGIVNRLDAEPGRFINPGDPVAEVLRLDRVKVKVGIPESDVSAVRHINQFDIQIDALDGRIFKGTTHFFSRTADPLARLYDLYIRVDNPDGEILPDMFVRVDILKKVIPDALVIPLYASLSQSDTHIVYVVKDGVAESRSISLGIQEGWLIHVVKGLSAGEEVIVVGQRSVHDGDLVNVVRQVQTPGEINR